MTDQVLYRKLSTYLKEKFGGKVWKIPVDAGFSCPNRDGTIGAEGCIYCNAESFDGSEEGSIRQQVKTRINRLRKKNIEKYIVYFQSYSNTYADLETIRSRVEEALCSQGIVAVHIGTRPDCIDKEKLEYFQKLNRKYEVVLEYGLQSANNETLQKINRGHTAGDFAEAVRLTHKHGIKTCAHVIFGLPGDTREDMLDSAALINMLNMHSVKFHHLHVVKNTKLSEMYGNAEITLMEQQEYIEILAEAIGLLNRDIVIGRLVGDASGDTLVAPKWPESKSVFINELEKYMKEKGIFQGSLQSQ